MYIRGKGRGKWQCIWEARDPATGRRRRVTEVVYGTKKDAEARWVTRQAELTAEAARPQPAHPRDWTVGDLLDHWLAVVLPTEGRALSTLITYRTLVAHHIRPTLGPMRLTALHPTHLQQAEATWLANGRADGGPLSPSTVRQCHAILRRALQAAVDWDLLPTNPASQVRQPRGEAIEMRVWTPAEIAAFWRVAQAHRYGPLFRLVLATGLRQGEALGLRWADIDWAAGTLHITQQLLRARRGAPPQLGPPKTARGRRTVAIGPDLIALLQRVRTAQKADRLACGPAYQDHGLVFQTPLGTPLHHRNVDRLLAQLIRRAGVPPIRFHDLRHTHAALLIADGWDPRLIADRLGHAQIAFTLQVYGHLFPGRQQEAATRLDRLFRE